MVRVAICILNYKSTAWTRRAVRSLVRYEPHLPWRLVLVDNGSTTAWKPLQQLAKHRRVEFQRLEDNLGFAQGYNVAVKIAIRRWDPKYIVVMNPDTCLSRPGQLTYLLQYLDDSPSDIAVAQPLVHNRRKRVDPRLDVQGRRLPTWKDLAVSESILGRYIWRTRYGAFIYREARPYTAPIRIDVPSGAFFVIRREVIDTHGLFDPRTFLYCEEYILGATLRRRGYSCHLVPHVCVEHEQGVATGLSFDRARRDSFRRKIESTVLYLRDYEHVGFWGRLLVRVAMEIGYVSRKVAGLAFTGRVIDDT